MTDVAKYKNERKVYRTTGFIKPIYTVETIFANKVIYWENGMEVWKGRHCNVCIQYKYGELDVNRISHKLPNNQAHSTQFVQQTNKMAVKVINKIFLKTEG